MIKCVVAEVGKDSRVAEIDDADTLSELQGLVGGYIDILELNDGIDLVVNDEGMYTCKPNRILMADGEMEQAGYISVFTGCPVQAGEPYMTLYGTIVAVSHDDEGNTVSLSDEQVATAQTMLDIKMGIYL